MFGIRPKFDPIFDKKRVEPLLCFEIGAELEFNSIFLLQPNFLW